VLSIEPEVSSDGSVVIRLRVTGARDRALQLVENLEKSRHFANPRLAGEALATSTGPNQQAQPINASMQENFDILSYYKPLTEAEEATAKTAETKTGEKAPGQTTETEAKPGTRTTGHGNTPKATANTPAGRRGAQ
jgi:type IV pilus assembly protein PilN